MSEFSVRMFSSIMFIYCGDVWMGSLQCQTGPVKSFDFYPKLSVLCFGSCHWIFQPDTKPAENHLRMLYCMGFFVFNLVLWWDVTRTMTLSPRASYYQLGQFSTVKMPVN